MNRFEWGGIDAIDVFIIGFLSIFFIVLYAIWGVLNWWDWIATSVNVSVGYILGRDYL